MKGAVTVARREFMTRVRSRGFVLSTIGVPVFLVAIVALPAWFAARSARTGQNLAVVDRTGVIFEGLAPRLERVGYTVSLVTGADADPGVLDRRIEEGDLGAVLLLDEETLASGRAVFRAESGPSAIRRMGLGQAVAQTALQARLAGTGEVELGALLSGGDLEVELVGTEQEEEERRRAGQQAGFAGAFLLYFVLLVYGATVLRSVMEEKTGRIVEIIVSSMKPWELMLGKIVGVGGVGLLQLAVWLASIVLLLLMGLPAIVASLPELEELGRLGEAVPSAGVMAYFVVSFILGYFIYASLFAAVGAMCSSEEEAQQAQIPVMLLVIVPFILLMPILERPDTAFAVAMSLVPFFTPLLMFGRVAAGVAGLWEVALSIVLMVLAVWGVAWVAGRIYRVGILMQGKRPNLPELWRWVRQS